MTEVVVNGAEHDKAKEEYQRFRRWLDTPPPKARVSARAGGKVIRRRAGFTREEEMQGFFSATQTLKGG